MKVSREEFVDAFKNFLEEKGLWADFVEGVDNKYGRHPDWFFRNHNGIANWVDSALVWDRMPQGHEFWSEVNNKWHYMYKSEQVLTRYGGKYRCKSIWRS